MSACARHRVLGKVNNAILELLRAECHPNVESFARTELIPIAVSELYAAPEVKSDWWTVYIHRLLEIVSQFNIDRDVCSDIGKIFQDVNNTMYY